MEEQRQLDKFDRVFAGLQGGNNLATKATTIQYIEPITGETETYTVQTVRAEYKENVTKDWVTETVTRVGYYTVINKTDRNGHVRLILPPKVTETLARGRESLPKKHRVNVSRARMKERMANGFVPSFVKK